MIGCFFYIIETAHYIKYGDAFVQLLGYGITINPKKRSKQYSDHSGVEQEFSHLFFGSIQQIKALESIIKQRVASKTHKIYGEPVEWISPKAKMSVEDMLTLVNDTIDQQGFNIKSLKEEFLPFDNLEHHRKITSKELAANPDLYLAS
jgi:uncharacterized protein (UPF0332 family)